MKDTPDRIWLYELPGQSLRMSRTKPPGESAEYHRVEGQRPASSKPGPKPGKVEVAIRVAPKVLNRSAKPKVTKAKA